MHHGMKPELFSSFQVVIYVQLRSVRHRSKLFLPGEELPGNNENPFLDNLFRHLVFNGELFIGSEEQVKLRLGYNHLRNKELTIENFRTLAGFSFGFGIKINRFYLDYGFGRYHVGGAANHFTISTNIREFTRNGITDN